MQKIKMKSFKNKCEIGADKGVINIKYKNCRFINILVENTYRSNNKVEYKEKK